MNVFKRKGIIFAAVIAAIFLAGCASNESRLAEANYATAVANQRTAEAQAAAEQAKTVGKLAEKIDAGGASAYLIATALKGLGLGQGPAPVQIQQPQSVFSLAWQTALQVADIALRGYGIKANRDVNLVQSNNNRDVSIASYGAFTTMGSAIASAGTAGYAYVQAPAANVTTTNTTLSGTGVLGSGTYTGPVTNTTTTTRTCNGGTGAAGGAGGGTTAGGAGAAGGAATGGNC